MMEDFIHTEIEKVPTNWEVDFFKNLADYNLGRTPIRNQENYWNNAAYYWVSISDMQEFGTILSTKESVSQEAHERIFRKKISPKGTLLMSFKLTIGRTSILNIDAYHNEAIISIYPNQKRILKEYLFYFLPQIDFSKYHDRAVKGITLNKSKIDSLEIIFPPLPEQRKIAQVLSTVQKAIEQQDNLIRTTTELKKAIMQKLFTEGTRGEKQKETEIGRVPGSWKTIKIGELGKCVTGTTPKTKVEDYWINPEFDFIAPADIGNTKYVYNSEKQISEAGLGVSRILPKNSVMCVCIGSSIGKVGLTIKEKSSTNQQINSIICNSDFNPVYVYYLMDQISEYWRGHATFGPVPILNKGQFEQIEIAVTKDMDEQNYIANSISVLDSKIEFHDTNKTTLTALFKTLLHELMTGQRRVHEIDFKALDSQTSL